MFPLLFLLLLSFYGEVFGKVERTNPDYAELKSHISLQLNSLSHNITLNVVFVGFHQEVVNTSIIDLNIKKTHVMEYEENWTITYNFQTNYIFADDSYYQTLKTFVLQASVNGTNTTSKLNVTALEIQKNTGKRMPIFLPQSGRAINATAVEEWFVQNPYETFEPPSYVVYVLNFTEFDSPDHSLEHWYNLTETDKEANSIRDFWRLEWDNELNPNVKFPYACFTSNTRVSFIDPSAFQWYLTWARIWWGLSVSGTKYDYYYEDLDQFLATHDVSTSQGKNDLALYLAGWLDDWICNLFAPYLWTDMELATAETMSIQVLVLNNVSQFGYTNEVVSWIINSTLIEEAILSLTPFINLEVNIKFCNLSDYPEIEAVFDNAVIAKENGWTYYDGGQIFYDLYAIRESYFNFTADIVINGYVLLEKSMSMMYWGKEFTGLGGGGQILVMKTLERYFRSDGVTPKSGLGLILIHEAGHNLGFPHTFQYGVTHAGDFSFDVMGYYPYSYHFCQLRKDSYRRLVLSLRLLNLKNLLATDEARYNRKPPTPIIDAKFDQINAKINETLQLCSQMRYLEAYYPLVEAENQEQELQELIWMYLCDQNNDGKIDIFDIATVAVSYGSKPGDPNWNPDADIIQDGIIDIQDVARACIYFGKSWA